VVDVTNEPTSQADHDRHCREVLAELADRFPGANLTQIALQLGKPGVDQPAEPEPEPDQIGDDEDVIGIMAPTRVEKARTLHTVLAALESPTEWLSKPDPLAWRDETTRVALYLCAEITRQLAS
jgi:hypothetical protein